MKALVVVAHPCDDSFCQAAAAAAQRGLTAAGHDVDAIDLYGEHFRAAMSRAERAAYESDDPIIDDQVADHVRRLTASEILVFVYPTWWSGPPAILKGWLERVMVPGVGFVFDAGGKVAPGLSRVRRIVGISTYGSPRPYVAAINDNGRRTIARALRMSCGWRTRVTWLGLYKMDARSPADREQFLAKVRSRMERI